MKLGEYSQKFKENDITGRNILEIKEIDLKEDLGMQSLGHRKNFLNH